MAEPHSSPESRSRTLSTVALVSALGVAVLLLYFCALALKRFPCLFLFPVVGLVAWPIWRYQADRVLFERRAILASVASQAGRIRRWFWAGSITSVFQVFVALFLAALLLGFLSALQPLHWAVLAGDAILLGLLFNWVKRSLTSEVREEHRGFAARRWPLTWLNVAVVMVLLVGLEFFLLDRPDTRALSWHEVARQAFITSQNSTACPAAGVFLGLTGAIDQTAWHAAMLLIPGLSDAVLRVLAWLVFLAWSVFVVFVFTRCLLGVIALVDGAKSAKAGARDDDPFSRVFVYTFLALAVPYILLSVRFADTGLAALDDLRRPPVAAEDPCRTFESDISALQTTIGTDVRRTQTEARTVAERRIDSAMSTAFGAAERGVDRYLDWYFSLIGEYTRLGSLFTGDIDQVMTEKLSKYVFNDTLVVQVIRDASGSVEAETVRRMTNAAESVSAQISNTINTRPCPIKVIDFASLTHLRSDKLQAAVSATVGVGAGALTTRYLAKRAVSGAAGKLAAKSTVRSAGKLLARGATKRGSSVLLSAASATGICAAAGPAAVICGAVAGAVTWIGIDKAMIEIDEARLRDQMRKELLEGLAEQKKTMGNELKARQRGWVDAYAVEIERTTAKVFNPAWDGL